MRTTGFLAALADDLARFRDPSALDLANLETVRKVAAEDRAVYYNGRYQGIIQANVRWVGRAMAALAAQGYLLEENATAIIREAGPPGCDAPALFGALVDRGFLQRQGTGLTFACSIPSLTSYTAIASAKKPNVHIAAVIGDGDGLCSLIAEGEESEGRDGLGRTSLHIAAECRWADVVRALLEAGADMGAPDSQGMSPRQAWSEFEWPDPPLCPQPTMGVP